MKSPCTASCRRDMGMLESVLTVPGQITCWSSLVLQVFSGYIFKRNFHVHKGMSKRVFIAGSGVGASP